jgi:uncharacterized protein YjbI with pentapeptide repeats
MITISTREQLAKMVDKHKDLTIDDDVLMEFSPTLDDIRDVKCRDLILKKDGERLNFNGRNFTGWDFTGGDFTGGDFIGGDFTGGNFTGWNFHGWNFTGRNFTGRNFTGRDFTGGNISYNAFFCCYGRIIKHGKIEGRHPNAHPPIELGKEQEDKS